MYKLGFIGAGNMGSAMIVAASKTIGGENIIIADHNQYKIDKLVEETGCRAAKDCCQVAREAEYIVFAVKPGVIRNVAKEAGAIIRKDMADGKKHIAVSIAAGISTDTIKKEVGQDTPVIRALPNTPALVGEGMILLTGDEEYFCEFMEIFEKAGVFEVIDESKMDYTSSVCGCTPAYAYMFISALADGACQVGVPRPQALRLAAQAVLGSARMVLETGDHPDLLKDRVCSPGGSTIVGVNALEENRFRYAAAQAVIKSTEKNIELGK